VLAFLSLFGPHAASAAAEELDVVETSGVIDAPVEKGQKMRTFFVAGNRATLAALQRYFSK
jgi:hypothetical protein